MIKLEKIFVLLFLLGLSVRMSAVGLDKRFQILPLPQQMEIQKGKGISAGELSFVTMKGEGEIPVLGNMLDALPRYAVKGVKGVTLSMTEKDVPVSPEGYVLEVSSKGIAIRARSQAGLFYGCQTLEQLMEDSRQFSLEVPAMKITDYPAIAYRAVHLDTKHHLDRTEYYYRMIDKLARYKVNAVIWELEDKLRYTRRPEVGAPNAIGKQEMQAICRYAEERNINISPLVQGLGHASFILKHHWELRESEKSDWEFCPSNPRTYEVLFDLYRDAMEAMPQSKYLHIGGDEISAIGIDGRCKATGKTAFQLQMEWLKKVCDFAVAHGRTPIFWDDMPLKYANLWWLLHRNVPDDEVMKNWNTAELDKAIDMFPKNCIYMRWHYEDPTILPHRMLLNWYHKKGLKVMGATSASTGETPFIPRNNSRVQYIKDFCALVAENQLEGILTTAWDDGSAHLETVMRGFIAQGEYGWHPGGRTIEDFITAHARREFGLQRKQMDFLAEMEKAAFFFDGALVVSGSRNPAWGVTEAFTLIELPDAGAPGKWSKKYENRLDSARIEAARYERITKGLQDAESHALRNRYTLDTEYMKILNLNSPDYTILNWIAVLVEHRLFSIRTPIARRAKKYLIDNFGINVNAFDIVTGYRADDSYFDYAESFLNNAISVEQLAAAMKLGKLGEQIVLKSQFAFSRIRFEGFDVAEKEEFYVLRKARDDEANRLYLELLEEESDGLYIQDIIRGGITNDDSRIPRNISE